MAPTSKSKILIQLQRNLTGWGGLHEVLEVNRTPEVDELLTQELAIEVKPGDNMPVSAAATGDAPPPPPG